MDDTKNPAAMDVPIGDGTHNPLSDQSDPGDETTAKNLAPIDASVGLDAEDDSNTTVVDTTMIGQLRDALAALEDEVGYEAGMARQKLSEAIHWLGQHLSL